jgi:hypothetical protein
MIKDSYGNPRFYGLYRGVVADNTDPLNKGRLKLRVPQVLAEAETDWAWPTEKETVSLQVPEIGQGVWVLFEGGDASYPIWSGVFGDELSSDYLMQIKRLSSREPISDVVDLLETSTLTNGTKYVDLVETLLNIVRNRYYGSFYSTASQTAVLANTAYAVPLDVVDSANGMSLVNGNTVRIEKTGVYNMAFSIQFSSSNNSEHIVDIWLRHQGVDVDNTNSRILFKGNAIAAWNFFLVNDTEPQDWQLMWSSHSANVVSISSIAAASPHPATPGVILTVNKVR